MTQEIDKKSAMKLFEAIFKKMNIADDKTIGDAKKMLTTFEISDYYEYTITISTGWVSKMLYKRTGKSNLESKTDYYLIVERK